MLGATQRAALLHTSAAARCASARRQKLTNDRNALDDDLGTTLDSNMPERAAPRSTNTLLSRFSATPVIQKRYLELNTSTLLLMTKIAAGASVGYFGFRYLKFRAPRQRAAIRQSLLRPPDIHIDQSIALLERPRKAAFLRRVFRTPPSGPMIVVGPTGSGKSHLMKRVLSRRPMTIYVDFRREPIVTGEEFVGTFVDNTGYAIPTPNELTKILYREEQRKNKITTFEAENALEVITSVFRREKDEGWRNGIPVICLDDFHLATTTNSADPYLVKFLDWCLHVADSKLAHVVIIPTMAFSENFLENYAPLRAKRLQLFVDYPRNHHVRQYIREVLQVVFKNNPKVEPEQIQQMSAWIFNCVGGNLEDLDQVISALKRGEHYGGVLRRMITDSVSMVEEKLESILQQADNLTGNLTKEDVYSRYMRFWKMMELLRDNDYVNRRDLIRLVFKVHTRELSEFVTMGIVTYVNQRPADEPALVVQDDLQDPHHHHSAVQPQQTDDGEKVVTFFPTTPAKRLSLWEQLKWLLGFSRQENEAAANNNNNNNNAKTAVPSPEKSNAIAKSESPLMAAAAATTAATQQAPATQPASTSTTDVSAAPAMIAAVNASSAPAASAPATPAPEAAAAAAAVPAAQPAPAASATASEPTATKNGNNKEAEDAQAYGTMLNASLDAVLVAAGSPRIRIAFDLLLKDPRIIEAKNAVEFHLQQKTLKDKLEKAEAKKKEKLDERSKLLDEFDTLVQKAAAYREELGEEVAEARLKRVITNETHVDQQLALLERNITELQAQLTQLEAAHKHGRKL